MNRTEMEKRKNLDAEAHERLKDTCVLLTEYATRLLGCGATCIRVEKNVHRMAGRFGVHAELTVLPSGVMLTVRDMERRHSYTANARLRDTAISFSMNTALSRLSWDVAEGRADRKEAAQRLAEAYGGPTLSRWLLLALVSAANASFCRLFGGDITSMGIVFVATACGFYLKQVMQAEHIDFRLTTFLAAFVAAVIASAGHIFGQGTTPDVAMGTSVLFLIPGIPYINSVSDLLDGHYLCAFSRFMHSAVLTVCISLGLCGALLLMNLEWF